MKSFDESYAIIGHSNVTIFSFLQSITKRGISNISINFVLMETGNEKLEIEYEISYGNRFYT